MKKGTRVSSVSLKLFENTAPDCPILIAGATASGKSALAMDIATRFGGRIINADALQVYEGWRILTARPTPQEEARVAHCLYGHVDFEATYSVGAWLRDLAPLLRQGPRPIIVGGTGLYFRALTEGLADIPSVPAETRAEADQISHAALLDALQRHDPAICTRIDTQNRARVQRWCGRCGGPRATYPAADTPAPLFATGSSAGDQDHGRARLAQ